MAYSKRCLLFPKQGPPWSKEEIGDDQTLYRRVPNAHWFNNRGEVAPSWRLIANVASKRGEQKLSFDWSKYSTAKNTACRMSNSEEQALAKYGVLQCFAGSLRRNGVEVCHDPLDDNRAHSEVFKHPLENNRFPTHIEDAIRDCLDPAKNNNAVALPVPPWRPKQ